MITKELTAQWLKLYDAEIDGENDRVGFSSYKLKCLLDVASAYGAEQRERELMAIEYPKPILPHSAREFASATLCYTAKQTEMLIAAARLQGVGDGITRGWAQAKLEAAQLLADYRETVDSAVERGNQIVLLTARIKELEAAEAHTGEKE